MDVNWKNLLRRNFLDGQLSRMEKQKRKREKLESRSRLKNVVQTAAQTYLNNKIRKWANGDE